MSTYADKRDKAIDLLMEEIRKIPPNAKLESIIWGCNSEMYEICEETYEWLATLRRFPVLPRREISDGNV